MRRNVKQLACRAMCIIALAAAAGSAWSAPRQTERSKQKAAAEATRAGIAQKLATLKRDVSKTEDAREDAADTLAESEEAISNANRALRDLAEEQQQTHSRLEELGNAQAKLAATIDAQKKQLSKLLREQYVAGNEDRIKLLLSGDNPNRINRDLHMMAYVSQAQARLLTALRTNLTQVEANQAAAQNANDELEEIAGEQRDQKTVLEKEKARRAALLGSLSARLAAQRKELGSLERDEQRMAGLVDKLSRLIKEQAEAAAAEQRRKQALAEARAKAKAKAEAEALAKAEAKAARQKAERERLAREAAKPGAKPRPVEKPPVEADEPKVAVKPEPEEDPDAAKPADVALAPAPLDGAFASLRGKLKTPVSGQVIARFGAKRGGGPSWKGMFIKAGEGSDIRAVAAGRVVFSSWMRGFGNLIIIDHGSEYLSIYGNNQSLLKRVGDAVRGGESIASAGNTGGNEESGLYFELRHRGAAFDPASWVSF